MQSDRTSIGTYVNKTLDTGALELTTVKLFNGCSQICSSLEFDKATAPLVSHKHTCKVEEPKV